MTTYLVTPLGWQFAVRRNGELVQVCDSREEANAAMKFRRAMEQLKA